VRGRARISIEIKGDDRPEKLCVRFFRAIFRFFRSIFHPFTLVEPIVWFTGLLALIAGIQTYAFIQSERSFLVLDSIAIISPENAVPVEISIVIKNGGKSGAQGTLYISKVFFKPLPDSPDYRNMEPTGLPPIVESGNARKTISIPLPTNVFMTDITSGNTPMNIYGYITYTDDFSWFGNRVTGFCATYNPRGNQSSMFNTCKENKYFYAH
jgi:hypothetical protein